MSEDCRYGMSEELREKISKANAARRRQANIDRYYKFTKEEFRYLHLVFLKDPNHTSEIDLKIKKKEGLRLTEDQVAYIKQKYKERRQTNEIQF